MMIRLVSIFALLVSAVNAEKHLRGMNHERNARQQNLRRNLMMGKPVDNSDSVEDGFEPLPTKAQTNAVTTKVPTGPATPTVGNIRDDGGAQPPLPPDSSGGQCRCKAICASVSSRGCKTAPCRTVCDIASKPNCVALCNDALNLPFP